MLTTALAIKLLYPIASYGITEGIKWVWEKYLIHWPTPISAAVAATIGGGLAAAMGTPGIDPSIGALMGLGAAAVHDVITPPSGKGSGTDQAAMGGAGMVTRMLLLVMMLAVLLTGCSLVQNYVQKNPHLVADQRRAINTTLAFACADPITANAALKGSLADGKIDFVAICK